MKQPIGLQEVQEGSHGGGRDEHDDGTLKGMRSVVFWMCFALFLFVVSGMPNVIIQPPVHRWMPHITFRVPKLPIRVIFMRMADRQAMSEGVMAAILVCLGFQGVLFVHWSFFRRGGGGERRRTEEEVDESISNQFWYQVMGIVCFFIGYGERKSRE
eukprot:TRINITY_DN936_c0_g1_i3.p2 TRINITY_DN936_c0_g1~~TRINITY_DN936_c0_g1_i3.p2  ORF type:complete len:157 (+),score=35.57 TRINITY_DN936_c0_g1_i3:480-950(+)